MENVLKEKLKSSRRKILKPKSKLNLVEWADKYRFLSAESSSEPGRFKTSRVEAARGPMLAVTNPQIVKITIQASTQLLKTEIINNIVAYHIHQDPCPMIVMQPTISLAETWSEDRLTPMIRDTPVLREQVVEKKSRDSGNTKDKKSFPGGYVAMIGANSPTELASRPVRLVLCDEVDKYPRSAGKEGDPIKLISERSATFWNSKIVHVCSPTNEGDSRISEEYLLSDQRIFETPCCHCNHVHEMQWTSVSWEDGKPETALYYCPECGESVSEAQRIQSIQKGVWRATVPKIKDHAGFKVSKMASPWETMPQLAKKYEEAKDDPLKMKTFINTQLAETYKETGDAPEWQRLYRNRENYEIGVVPSAVVLLTMGVDVQKDRIELEVVGWCRDRISFSVDYQVLEGDTDKEEVWDKLEDAFNYFYPTAGGGELPLKAMAIDTGYRTSEVYKFCRRFSPSRVFPVKGSDALATPVGSVTAVDVKKKDGKREKRGLKLWSVGVSFLKSELYSLLGKEPPLEAEDDYPKGYCHFPEYDQEFFKMMTAEELREEKDKYGRLRKVWCKIRERNESLDCRVYNIFLSYVLKLHKASPERWDKLESEQGNLPNSRRMESTTKSKKKSRVRRRSSDFL